MTKIVKVSWNRFETDVRRLAFEIEKSKVKFSNVYGQPRGGLVVAVRLSHLLGIPLITNPIFLTPNSLYVDDVIDTGKTLQYASQHWSIAVLYFNPEREYTSTLPTIFIGGKFYVHEKPKDSWIIFPWEKR